MTVKEDRLLPATKSRPKSHPEKSTLKTVSSLQSVLDYLLQYVEEGVFFLNKQLTISEVYSHRFEELLGREKLAQENFLQILKNRVPDKIIKKTEEFLHFMFQAELEEEVIQELNPLTRVEFFFEDELGMWSSSRFFSFKFRRIYDQTGVVALMGIVQDVSEWIQLQKAVQESRNSIQKQMEWLVNILHVEPDILNEFFKGVEHELGYIDKTLKGARDLRFSHQVLENIYRSLHIIKGNATLLDLEPFVNQANQFIRIVQNIKQKTDLIGNDFVPIVVQLSEMRKKLEEVRRIFKQIQKFHRFFRAKRSYESFLLINSLKTYTRELSKQLGKNVQFELGDFDVLSIPYVYRKVVRDILFLLIRNTLLYGVETPEEREKLGKSPTSHLQISSFQDEKSWGLILRHDGRIGRIEQLLKEKIYGDGEQPENGPDLNGSQIAELIFVPGNISAGESQVMDNFPLEIEVLKQKLRKERGKLKISFTSEKFCEFTIAFPLKK